MPDNKVTTVTPTEEGCASWNAEMSNSAEVIKKIKRNNNFRRQSLDSDLRDFRHQSPEPGSSNPIQLPHPIFREVPVHVTRAPNRSIQAVPPPSAQPQALPSRRKNEGRRRPKRLGGNGDGDGSESDSGGDERRNGRHSPEGPLQKRKPPPPKVEQPSRDPRSLKGKHVAQKVIVLSPEEEERVQNLKRLHAFEKTCGNQLDLRSLNKAKGKHRRDTFSKGMALSPPSSRFSELVAQQQAALNKYLDESLYSAIVGDRLSSKSDENEKQSVITNLIAETESKVIEFIKSALRSRLTFEDQESWPGTTFFVRPNRGDQFPADIQLPLTVGGKHNEHIRIDSNDLHLRQRVSKDPLFETYLDLITDGTLEGDIGGLPLEELLFFSVKFREMQNQVAPEFLEALRSRVGATTFDALVSRRILHTAENPIEAFKRRMEDVHMDVSQEFFQFGAEVELVLFKGGRPSTIQRVLPDDLQRMGWRQGGEFAKVGQEGAARRYWRYAVFDDHPGGIFTVDMEGNILGALGQSDVPVLAVQ